MTVLFTDLDGTLLDEAYSWEAARPAIELLERRRIPWVLVSSKTRSEMEALRAGLGHAHPFVVENGGAAYIPRGYFGCPVAGASARGGYEVLSWGAPYGDLVRRLQAAAAGAKCPIVPFSAMTVEEVSQATGLPAAAAARAMQREYDEVFSAPDKTKIPGLLEEIERAGLRWTHGGRFYHICGDNDKAIAVRALIDLFTARHGAVETIGLGDSLNDLPFLRVVDIPVVIRGRRPTPIPLRRIHARYTRSAGPRGWNEAVTGLLTAGDATQPRHR